MSPVAKPQYCISPPLPHLVHEAEVVLPSFPLPGLCYHSYIVRKISSVSFQSTSSLLTVPINKLLDRLLIV